MTNAPAPEAHHPRTAAVEMEFSKRWANENPALAYERLSGFIATNAGWAFSIKHESDGFITYQAVNPG